MSLFCIFYPVSILKMDYQQVWSNLAIGIGKIEHRSTSSIGQCLDHFCSYSNQGSVSLGGYRGPEKTATLLRQIAVINIACFFQHEH